MSHGLGVVYEPHDPRTERYPASDLIGIGSPVSGPMVDHVHAPDGWPDQFSTESCVGQAIRQAVWIRQAMLGIPIGKRIAPSDRDIYYRARASRHGWKNVVDIGSNPVAGWECLRDPLGIVEYDALPFDASKVDDAPSPSIYRRSIDRDWLHYHWLLDDDSRLTDLDALLGTGRPVVGAVTVDQGLLDWTPSQGPWRYRGPRKGGHYLCFVHADRESCWAIGSWGSDYGAGGLHQIARSEMASSRVSYLATPDIDPERVMR